MKVKAEWGKIVNLHMAPLNTAPGLLDWNSLTFAAGILPKESKNDSKAYPEDSDTNRHVPLCHAENKLHTSNL